VVQHYFDALYEVMPTSWGSLSSLRRPARGGKGELKVLTVPDWMGWSGSGPSAKSEGNRVRIHRHHRPHPMNPPPSSRCAASCAALFTDYLVAMKLKEGWQIRPKSYRYDLKDSHTVIAGLDPASIMLRENLCEERWMRGSSPRMTTELA